MRVAGDRGGKQEADKSREKWMARLRVRCARRAVDRDKKRMAVSLDTGQNLNTQGCI